VGGADFGTGLAWTGNLGSSGGVDGHGSASHSNACVSSYGDDWSSFSYCQTCTHPGLRTHSTALINQQREASPLDWPIGWASRPPPPAHPSAAGVGVREHVASSTWVRGGRGDVGNKLGSLAELSLAADRNVGGIRC
jgi:hypothetical protein